MITFSPGPSTIAIIVYLILVYSYIHSQVQLATQQEVCKYVLVHFKQAIWGHDLADINSEAVEYQQNSPIVLRKFGLKISCV